MSKFIKINRSTLVLQIFCFILFLSPTLKYQSIQAQSAQAPSTPVFETGAPISSPFSLPINPQTSYGSLANSPQINTSQFNAAPINSINPNLQPYQTPYPNQTQYPTEYAHQGYTSTQPAAQITPPIQQNSFQQYVSEPTTFTPSPMQSIGMMARREKDRIFSDFGNLYRCDNALNFGVALAGGAVLANTSMDRHFRNWYQDDVRSKTSDDIAKVSKVFGEGKYFIPAMLAPAVIYRYWQERTGNAGKNYKCGDFFDRTTRGYIVGAPTLLIGQYLLGSDRPRDGSSYWRPFEQDHGISGHAYMGAIPFITAAQMSDKLYVKGIFYALSIMPGWSRVNDDAHYLSQVILGWYLAYLSVRAVSETESPSKLPKGLTIFPIADGNYVGMGLLYKR